MSAEGAEGTDAAVRLWRVARPIRRAALGTFALFVVVAATLTALGITFVGALCVWSIALSVMVFVWRWYLVPHVALTPEGLEVQGPLTHRSLPRRAIVRVRPGVIGLRIDTAGGGEIPAWAIQKSKAAEWLHRETRADDVAAAILDHAAPRPARRAGDAPARR